MWLLRFIIFSTWLVRMHFATESPESIRHDQAIRMKSYMNELADPCENFYEYACGNWSQYYRNKTDEMSFGVPDVITDNMHQFFREVILYNNHTSKEKIDIFRRSAEAEKIRNYYSLCRQQKGANVKQYIDAWGVPGGWPALTPNNWNDSQFDWLNITAYLKIYDVPSLLDVKVLPYYLNASRNAIYVIPAVLPIFKSSSYIDQRNPAALLITEAITQSFVELNVSLSEASKIARNVLRFEKKLAKLLPDDEGEEDVEDMTVQTMQQLLPDIDLERFLNIVSGGEVTKSNHIVLLYRSYFSRLVTLLKRTKSDLLANFFLYRFSLSIDSPDNLANQIEQSCMDELISHLGFALGHFYNQIFNKERDNKDVGRIAKSIKTVFARNLRRIRWMDEETRKEALKKLDNLLMKIGDNDDELISKHINEEFSYIDFDPSNYYKNYFKLNAYTIRKEYRNLQKISRRSESDFNAATVNAIYHLLKNHMIIPTSILQSPVYDYHFPYSVKYGALGSIIGHEMTHSLDSFGHEYDSSGTFRNWWTWKSTIEYLLRTKCLENQYQNYWWNTVSSKVFNIKSDTLDENIADNGGLRISYKAYQKWLKKNPHQTDTFPELNLTSIQLFFLSFAQFFCESVKPVAILLNSLSSEHSKNEYRVLGSLSNFKQFAQAFNCPAGSRMNPSKRCRMW